MEQHPWEMSITPSQHPHTGVRPPLGTAHGGFSGLPIPEDSDTPDLKAGRGGTGQTLSPSCSLTPLPPLASFSPRSPPSTKRCQLHHV